MIPLSTRLTNGIIMHPAGRVSLVTFGANPEVLGIIQEPSSRFVEID